MIPTLLRKLALVAGTLLLAAGCAAPSKSGYTYTEREARRPMQVEMAVIEAIREVRLERSRPDGVGTAAGAVVGGVAGSNIGGGSGRIVGSVLGAVAGGVAGSYIEKSATDRPALEITVRTDSGRVFAVVQEAGGEQFAPGQRVRILTDSRGTTRVSY
ncbi:glycine zipper 2TM domain-containing protein [Burkholderiaceae bacterium FT117]|uniref:glycine zipper 2TM domain-containing protein n=1 Tax=Zeimonas sediminis TaxID=2944268 RepID=UPI002342BE7D|nr:glycine zipper 2TM domain-containing protein [Zeimonas sediminis]MCM5571310.1 glycine zipper 2TM domain-containing protein [Zeimonas sediminis]